MTQRMYVSHTPISDFCNPSVAICELLYSIELICLTLKVILRLYLINIWFLLSICFIWFSFLCKPSCEPKERDAQRDDFYSLMLLFKVTFVSTLLYKCKGHDMTSMSEMIMGFKRTPQILHKVQFLIRTMKTAVF